MATKVRQSFADIMASDPQKAKNPDLVATKDNRAERQTVLHPSLDDDFLANPPKGTRTKSASTVDAVLTGIERLYDAKRKSGSDYVVFSNVPLNVAWKINEQQQKGDLIITHTRYFYSQTARKLIVAPDPFLCGVNMYTREMLQATIAELGLQDARKMNSPWSRKGYDPWIDAAFWRPPALQLKLRWPDCWWASLIVETGDIEDLGRMRSEMAWWLGRSGMNVRLVFVIAVDRLSGELVIEAYRPQFMCGSYYPTAVLQMEVHTCVNENSEQEVITAQNPPTARQLLRMPVCEGNGYYEFRGFKEEGKGGWMRSVKRRLARLWTGALDFWPCRRKERGQLPLCPCERVLLWT